MTPKIPQHLLWHFDKALLFYSQTLALNVSLMLARTRLPTLTLNSKHLPAKHILTID
jgi:hypothetical protein